MPLAMESSTNIHALDHSLKVCDLALQAVKRSGVRDKTKLEGSANAEVAVFATNRLPGDTTRTEP